LDYGTHALKTTYVIADRALQVEDFTVTKMAVFWVVAPDRPDDGGSKDLSNVGKLLPDYTALQPRRQPSSYSPP
jgi:hypothetical protein